ncbi:MAG TPA: S8 family serine peptidase, partial [Pyrinomonadaceae bacterium]
MTILLIACMCASVLLSGSAQANLNPTKGKATSAATQEYPNLRRFGSNLTRLARLGKLQKVDGYDAEIAGIVESLANSNAAPVLVGESTLQRSAIVRGLALRIASGDVPASLRNKQIFSLSLDALADGAKTSREFESRVQAIVAETATANGNIVLFLDELQEYAGKRATTAASGALQTALRQNGLQVIGAASPAAYDEYIASDQTLAGLFKALRIGEIEATATASNGEIEASPRTQGFEGDKISPDMRELMQSAAADGTVTAILQVSDVRSSQLRSLLKRHGVVVSGQMSELGALKVQLPVKTVEELAASGLTNYVSPDVTLESFGHVTSTTGTDLVRVQASLLGLITTSTLDGEGIGIAVLDSGVDSAHRSFDANVKFKKDFTVENNPNNDPYGHGTHVASAAAGISSSNGNSYQGMAPGANI